MSSMELRQRGVSFSTDQSPLPQAEQSSTVRLPGRSLPTAGSAQSFRLSSKISMVLEFLCLGTEPTTTAYSQPSHASRQLILHPNDYASMAGVRHESDPWVPRHLPAAKCAEKMLKNANKALREHFLFEQRQTILKGPLCDTMQNNPYALTSELFGASAPSVKTGNLPLSFPWTTVQAQGPRPSLEDAHFFQETDDYILTGIFDGHSGPYVANYAKNQFPKKFFNFLSSQRDNIHYTFEETVYSIQKEIEWFVRKWESAHPGHRYHGGSTMVCCFIDKKTMKVTTATVGDCEANIYREFGEEGVKSIPLSCIRDWHSKKEAKRASLALGDPTIATLWPKAEDPKLLRYPPEIGVNVSRALGDIHLQGTRENPGLLCKPKITEMDIQVGDQIILCSDGLKDALMESYIVSLLTMCDTQDVAESLVYNALEEMKALNYGDNVTITHIAVVG